MKTKLLIEQHFHGAFGVDFNNCSVEDVHKVAKEILKFGIGGIFPTLVTDSVENIKRQISVIKKVAELQTPDMARILGIHLEGIFLNPDKKGIHNSELFLEPTIDNYRLIEDDFIKIVTYAPEFDKDNTFAKYLKSKGVKVQAGHCTGGDLTHCDGVTHLFNAMSGVTHRGESTALSALVNDDIYTEIIADGVHVSDDALRLVFKSKPIDKILLISDCLPCTKLSTENGVIEIDFAGEKVYYDGQKAVSKAGTIAGSTVLLPDIIKRLGKMGLFKAELIENTYRYHNLELNGEIEWDEEFNIKSINKILQ